MGVVAQEVQQVAPELVLEDSEGTLSVAYQNMVALLIEAVKEQSAEIAALKEIIPIVSRLNAAQAENVLTFLLNKSQRELKARSIYGAQLLGLERK